ncbi:MAG: hypothetical protein ACFCUJ_12345 [Thiotrichales bacterium]
MLQDLPFDQPGFSTLDYFVEQDYSPEQCEAYYRWWFEWSKHFVEYDVDLRATHLASFDRFPITQFDAPFSQRNVGFWATEMDALGSLVISEMRPKLDEFGRFALAIGHRKLLEDLEIRHRSESSAAIMA